MSVEEEETNSPTPPWQQAKKPTQSTEANPPMATISETTTSEQNDALSDLKEIISSKGGFWPLIIVGASGGFGIAALLFVTVSSLAFKNKMSEPYMWYVYAGVGLVALILWSWSLSRIRIVRSQAQDPDFSDYVEKRPSRRKSKRKKKQTEEELEELEKDDDQAPWL